MWGLEINFATGKEAVATWLQTQIEMMGSDRK